MAKRGRKPKYLNKACPNKSCSFYGKKGEGNIVSNGTYPSKRGRRVRQFVCRGCKKSFSNRTGTIFYNLRTPRKKVLLAFLLLTRGTPLRWIAVMLEVKLDTIRLWLKLAAAMHSTAGKDKLSKELKVSEVELDALCIFVKTNSLRKRATLWKAKRGFKYSHTIQTAYGINPLWLK